MALRRSSASASFEYSKFTFSSSFVEENMGDVDAIFIRVFATLTIRAFFGVLRLLNSLWILVFICFPCVFRCVLGGLNLTYFAS